MKLKMIAILPGVLLAAALAGCTMRVGDFTAMSTKNIPRKFKVRGQGQGEDIQHLYVIIPDKARPSIKEATDQAIESQRGDALVNAKIYSREYYIPYIYGEFGYVVKGEVVSTREMQAQHGK